MQTAFRDGKGLMEFKTIITEWKHREKAKYLTTEANWIIRRSHAMQNMGFVLKGALVDFPVDKRTKKELAKSQAIITGELATGASRGLRSLLRQVPGQC